MLLCLAAPLSISAEEAITCGLRYKMLGDRNVTIIRCMFNNLWFNENGGAIYLNSPNIIASINYSSFENCSSVKFENSGGAIYCSAKLLSLSSICCLDCSAAEGSFVYFTKNLTGYDCSLSLNSISSFHCYVLERIHGNVILSRNADLGFKFLNISDTSYEILESAIKVFDAHSFDSSFATISGMTVISYILMILENKIFPLSFTNIINNSCNSFCYVYQSYNVSFCTCIFANNSFDWLVKSDKRGHSASFKNCWFCDGNNNISSTNVTFKECNFTWTCTLGFSDRSIFTDGFYCGIRLPSPSKSLVQSISNKAKALTDLDISMIVVGSAIFLTSFGGLIWYYTKKVDRQRYQPAAEAISLLRELDNAYG